MQKPNKPIRMSAHASMRSRLRGTSKEEILDAIKTTPWQNSALNKLECQKDFVFNNVWNNKTYKTKQVRPIFVEERAEIVVVTVYVYYF